ncbi:hypothetical protein ACMWQU_26740, partial [Escherichia coli]|uniref:hypothetical protein n=1 Tax=Escherichia coli TaxID=562 RepID=UPI0039E10E63
NFSFDIVGLKADKNNEIVYGLSMEVQDGKGKTIFKQEYEKDKPSRLFNPFGGGKLAATSFLEILRDLPHGKYTVKLVAHD